MVRQLILCAISIPVLAQSSVLHIYYDHSVPQLSFAASEIRRVVTVVEHPLGQLRKENCSPCIVLAANAAESASTARILGLAPSGASTEQAFSFRRLGQANAILAADPNGALYGALDVAESLRIERFNSLTDYDRQPHIARRGIKFNIPLDARTPSYSDNATASQANIPEMWSLDFWREFLDEMARHRYNVLSLWNLHPFPSIVKVPEYPDVALSDVKRSLIPFDETFTFSGSDLARPSVLAKLETVRHLSIDAKIDFWREVMRYAKSRGIDVYWFTWNMFTFGAEGKYGISLDMDDPETIAYFRASVRETVLTYPLLAGIGITAGEQMKVNPGGISREKWLWSTYGEGIRDALKLQPSRPFNLIHRYHMTGQDEIFNEFKDYPGNMDLSFKYSIAHMYSIPNPPYIKELLPNLPPNRRTWLTVRNDDVYSFRWGNSAYARTYIKNMPGPEKVAGFYMGPDGFNWGRDFLSRDATVPRQLVISKQWYSFLLWGRLSYDPELSDDHLNAILSHRFPSVPTEPFAAAWSSASMVFPLITRFFWGDIDLRWFPEACLSHPRHRGYYTVRDFVGGSSAPGSGVLAIIDWRKRKLANQPMDGITPLEIAKELDQSAAKALGSLPALRGAADETDTELAATLTDIEAMAHLARYYSLKIRAAAALALFDAAPSDQTHQQEAIALLQEAVSVWRDYARAYTSQYHQPVLYNRVGFVDLHNLTARAQDDVRLAQQWRPGTFPGDTKDPQGADVPFRR